MKHSTTQGYTEIKITPHFSSDFSMVVKAFILSKLTSDIPKIDETIFSQWNELQTLQLADKNQVSGEIDIILGVNQFLKILREGLLIGPDELIAQNTALGWIIGGGEQNVVQHVAMGVQVDFNIDQSLQKFWEIEEVQISQQHLSPEEQLAEDHFKATHSRDSEGRFIVRLPLKNDAVKFGNSLSQAQSRFFSIERKLNRDSHLKTEYCSFMQEYIDLGHMVELKPNEHQIPELQHFYLPHHPVVKETNLTTKVRIVFDGSARSTTGESLNQNLLVGFPVQPDLISTIMRFRLHKIAVTSDVEKMYRQVQMNNDDANYQRIVWRENSTLPLRHYKLITVTYGTSSAPFQATRCLKQLAIENEGCRPAAARAISEDFYVDDLLSGANSLEEATQLCNDVIGILNSGGFSLRKWASNSTELLNSLPHNNDENFIVDLMKPDHKILGISWDPSNDSLSFKINIQMNAPTYTKRNLLSEASKLFDPIGWLAPVTISIKILFQQVWILHLDWDDPLTEEISERWNKIRNDLPLLEQIKISRYLSTTSSHLQLHGFCDASLYAYAAVIYCRSIDECGNVQVNIITSKTRVAPIKSISIPRLELCGAHLLAKLATVVKKNLQLSNVELFMWSDSQVVLQWLSQHPSSWKTFIANRTSEILTLLPKSKWNHVPSSQNPADCASRGVLPPDLLNHDLWWHGPQWLTKSMDFWPKQTKTKSMSNQELEVRKIIVNHAILENEVVGNLVQGLSHYPTIRRVLAYIIKFITKLKNKRKGSKEAVTQWLNTAELKAADNFCIKWAQNLEFSQEIKSLLAKQNIIKGRLSSLTPFLDENGVLRVGGRLSNSQCSYWSKHPAILPPSNILSHLILSYLHKLYQHPGPSLLSHLSRQSYWIVNVRKLSRQITNKCLICHRFSSRIPTQLMGSLPSERVTPSRPFTQTALDYAGPIQIASKRGRGAKLLKAYICIFVCMSVKAVHLEAVTDLTSDAFIAALKRFVSRRGLPQRIVSDNGTNFIGAKRKLQDDHSQIQFSIKNQDISAFISNRGIDWSFSPPSSPHFNGLSEAAVRSVKHHLLRSLGQSHFTFEELATFLCQTEAILNSRPLTPMSGDVEDINILTPSHFLTTGPLLTVPELQYPDVSDNRLSRWQEIKKRVDCFWSRYVKEYSNNLQQKGKWKGAEENVRVGDIVYIKENTPPLSWPIGRIIHVNPGDDGFVRVATVKTASTTLKRPIVKLVKLPIEDNQDSNQQSTAV